MGSLHLGGFYAISRYVSLFSTAKASGILIYNQCLRGHQIYSRFPLLLPLTFATYVVRSSATAAL